MSCPSPRGPVRSTTPGTWRKRTQRAGRLARALVAAGWPPPQPASQRASPMRRKRRMKEAPALRPPRDAQRPGPPILAALQTMASPSQVRILAGRHDTNQPPAGRQAVMVLPRFVLMGRAARYRFGVVGWGDHRRVVVHCEAPSLCFRLPDVVSGRECPGAYVPDSPQPRNSRRRRPLSMQGVDQAVPRRCGRQPTTSSCVGRQDVRPWPPRTPIRASETTRRRFPAWPGPGLGAVSTLRADTRRN